MSQVVRARSVFFVATVIAVALHVATGPAGGQDAVVPATPFLQVVQAVLRTSPRDRIPEQQRAIARLDLQTARQRLVLTGGLDGSLAYVLHRAGPQKTFGPQVQAQVDVLDGGIHAAEAAIARIEGSEADANLQADALATFVAAGAPYTALWQAQDQIVVVSALKREIDKDVTTLSAAYRIGVVGEIDVERARAQAQLEATALAQTQNDERTERAVLNILMDRDPGAPLIAQRDLGLPPPAFADAVAAIAAAQRQNPQLALDRLAVASAQEQIALARAQLRPTLGAAASSAFDVFGNAAAIAATNAAPPATGGHLQGTVGLSLAIPLFDVGVARRAVERARAQTTIAALTFADDRRAFSAEAVSDYYAWVQSGVNVRNAQLQQQLASRVLAVSRQANVVGVAPYYEVVNDEQALLNAELSTVSALASQSSALLQLEAVTAMHPVQQALSAANVSP